MSSQMKEAATRRYIYQGDARLAPPPPDLALILDRHKGQPDALITVLEELQEHYGYLPKEAIEHVSRELGFPLSRVYGVVTFYNLFQLNPPGRYIVRVCRGTACHVNRSDEILKLIKARLGVKEDETTVDHLFTLQTVACVGACSLAPVVVVNDRTYGRMSPDLAEDVVAALAAEAKEEASA